MKLFQVIRALAFSGTSDSCSSFICIHCCLVLACVPVAVRMYMCQHQLPAFSGGRLFDLLCASGDVQVIFAV